MLKDSYRFESIFEGFWGICFGILADFQGFSRDFEGSFRDSCPFQRVPWDCFGILRDSGPFRRILRDFEGFFVASRQLSKDLKDLWRILGHLQTIATIPPGFPLRDWQLRSWDAASRNKRATTTSFGQFFATHFHMQMSCQKFWCPQLDPNWPLTAKVNVHVVKAAFTSIIQVFVIQLFDCHRTILKDPSAVTENPLQPARINPKCWNPRGIPKDPSKIPLKSWRRSKNEPNPSRILKNPSRIPLKCFKFLRKPLKTHQGSQKNPWKSIERMQNPGESLNYRRKNPSRSLKMSYNPTGSSKKFPPW